MTESAARKLHLMKVQSVQCIKSLQTYHYTLSPTSGNEECVSGQTDREKHTKGRRRRLARLSRPTNLLTSDLHLALESGPSHPDLIITLSPAGTFRPPHG